MIHGEKYPLRLLMLVLSAFGLTWYMPVIDIIFKYKLAIETSKAALTWSHLNSDCIFTYGNYAGEHVLLL